MDVETTSNPQIWFDMWDASADKTAAGAYGMKLVEIDADHVVVRMPITPAARQPMGLFHGGVSMLLAESAASMHACFGIDLTKQHPVGIEISGSHLNSARDGHVVATGRVIKRGRTLIVHEVEIVHEESQKTLNVSRVTNLYVAVRPSED